MTSSLFIDRLFGLAGRRALVTGGGSGLGAAMAIALAGAGAEVILIGRRLARLEATRETIHRDGGQCTCISADLFDDTGIDDVLHRAKGVGGVDILVNAAGVNPRRPAEELTRAEWDQTLHLNLTVPFLLSRGLVADMTRRGQGRIINIGSLQSVRAFADSMAYGAAKGGVVQLTRAMAQAWSAQGVCCNAIAPGLFPTELTTSIFQDRERQAAMAAATCVGRNGRLDDIQGITVFLASAASAFVTGQTIFIDGGFTAR